MFRFLNALRKRKKLTEKDSAFFSSLAEQMRALDAYCLPKERTPCPSVRFAIFYVHTDRSELLLQSL
jgi:precorrin-4 methylase